MDHIPMPRNPVHAPVQIPLFCRRDYDGKSFLRYIEEIGSTSDHILHLCKSTDSHDELNAILQEWCYFGLMTEIFGWRVRIEDFSDHSLGTAKYITTKSLPRYVSEWSRSQCVLGTEEKHAGKRHMSACFTKIRKVLMEIYLESGDTVDGRLVLSIAVLIECLEVAKRVAFGNISLEVEEGGFIKSIELFSPIGIPQAGEYIASRMQRDGWCPNEIRVLSNNTSQAQLYFISNLERPGAHRDHTLSQCTEFRCNAYQIQHNNYQRQHIAPDCCCQDIYASQEELLEILSSKGDYIPLIVPFAMQQRETDLHHVQLVSSQLESEYVAISHVWSDGLGNDKQNAIPLCQFNRISELVTELYGGSPKPFWLDTLCFPLEPPEAYRLAMIRMRSTYEDSHKVLVLDGYLLSIAHQGMSDGETVTRILCSPWSRRLWTLQEGALPPSIAFRFSDVSVDLRHYSQERYEMIQLGDEVFQGAKASFHELRSIEWDYHGEAFGPKTKATRTTGLYNVHTAKAALSFRSTSVQEDEALCLSALLDQDISTILAAPEQERMKTVWSNVLSLSPQMIFWTDPKLEQPGYRWASSTFLGGRLPCLEFIVPGAPWAELTEKGLMVTYPGVLLSGTKRPLPICFHVKDERGFCFQVVRLEDRSGSYDDRTEALDPWYEFGFPATKLAIIVSQELDPTYNPSAILAVVETMDEEVIKVRWLNSVAIVRVEVTDEAELEKHIDSDREHEAVFQAIHAEESYNAARMKTGASASDLIITSVPGSEADADYKHSFDYNYERLRQIPHDQRESLCSCKTQWVLRGRRTKKDQVWRVD